MTTVVGAPSPDRRALPLGGRHRHQGGGRRGLALRAARLVRLLRVVPALPVAVHGTNTQPLLKLTLDKVAEVFSFQTISLIHHLSFFWKQVRFCLKKALNVRNNSQIQPFYRISLASLLYFYGL